MPELRRYTIDAARPTYVRAGIKWDPLERDDIEEMYSFGSVKDARKKLGSVRRWLRFYKFMAGFVRATFLIADMSERFEDWIEHKEAKKVALDKFLTQAKLQSYDLDLCCFCYGKDDKLIGSIAPAYDETSQNLQQDQLAIMHSGDDVTGTGDAFDEELLINLHAIEADIHQMFLVVISVNHGFDKIKGGFWSIIRTKDETELMSAPLHKEPQRAHVMAKLTRDGTSWIVDEVAAYCPLNKDEKIPMRQRVDQLLAARFIAAGATSAEVKV